MLRSSKIFKEAEAPYRMPIIKQKKLIDNTCKILESEGRVMIIALKASLNIYLQDLRAGKKNNENKE